MCLDKLYALPNPPKLPRAVLKNLLVFATKRSHFVFDGQYYDQVDGVAIGSPLGPVLANIFMCHFEEKWVMNSSDCPNVWFRYVDDPFTLFRNKETAVKFLVGGAVASWLVRSSPDRAVRVRALAGDIVLCSWARLLTLTVPLSTKVYKWVPANLMLGSNPAMDWHPIQEGVEILLVASCHGNRS